MRQSADIIVIGAGIAGISAAAELAANAEVTLLEMESHPGYHATGRSAAFFAASYGNQVIQGVTRASEPFYRSPSSSFTDLSLLRARDCLFIGRQEQLVRLAELANDNSSLKSLSVAAVSQRVPILSTDYVEGALLDDAGGDLDVDAILNGYLRLFRNRGGKLLLGQKVAAMDRVAGNWQVRCEQEVTTAPIVVNAGGAWADDIAVLAGLERLGIMPMRRTAILIDPPAGEDIADWPLVVDVDEEFYFKPDAGQLLVSPADETPSEPCDARPNELDIAIAVDRFEAVTGLAVERVKHRWAGLRTFAPDKTFVAGFDPRTRGFFWLAGQGGYGVQSAPGMAQLTSSLVTGAQLTGEFANVLAYADKMTPERLINH